MSFTTILPKTIQASIYIYLSHGELLNLEESSKIFKPGLEFFWQRSSKEFPDKVNSKITWKQHYETHHPEIKLTKAVKEGRLVFSKEIDCPNIINMHATSSQLFTSDFSNGISQPYTISSYNLPDFTKDPTTHEGWIIEDKLLRCDKTNSYTLLELETGDELIHLKVDSTDYICPMELYDIEIKDEHIYFINKNRLHRCQLNKEIELLIGREGVLSYSSSHLVESFDLTEEKITSYNPNELCILNKNFYSETYSYLCNVKEMTIEKLVLQSDVGSHTCYIDSKVAYSSSSSIHIKDMKEGTRFICQDSSPISTFTKWGNFIVTHNEAGELKFWLNLYEKPYATLETGFSPFQVIISNERVYMHDFKNILIGEIEERPVTNGESIQTNSFFQFCVIN